MRTLWFLPKWPYPAIDGATRANMALLKAWPKASALDLVIFSNEEKTSEEISELQKVVGFENLLILPTSKVPRFILVLLALFKKQDIPTTVKRFVSKLAQKKWAVWSEHREWTHLVFDGLHPSALFFNQALWSWKFPARALICGRAHNLETEFWSQVQERSGLLLRWIYSKEHARMESFETSFYQNCNLITPVSEVDAGKIRQMVPGSQVIPAFIGMDWSQSPKLLPTSDTLELMFIGRMDWYPNVEGLNWFLDEVWPEVVRQRKTPIRLHIVGGFAGPKLIEKIQALPQVQFHGRVNDVSKYYEQVVLTLIPILTGSGTRVKAIESAQYGRSFLSTTKGIEGVNLDPNLDYLVSDAAGDWIQALLNLSLEECQKLGGNAHAKLKNSYDQSKIQEHFVEQLKSLVPRK